MSSPNRHYRSNSSGYTLLELIIVLGLLAFLMAIVWPSLRRPLQRSTTQQAARQLVADLGGARFSAIQTGRTMLFQYEPGGDRYWIGPADEAADSAEVTDSLEDSFGAGPDGSEEDDLPTETVIQGMLEDGAVFADPEADEDAGFPIGSTLADTLADEMAETESVEPLIQDEGDVNWSTPVLIYPTGRAENASFVLQGPEGYSVTVTLRGLTGSLTIGPIEHKTLDNNELGTMDPDPQSERTWDGSDDYPGIIQ